MAQQLDLKARGLFTNPNPIGSVPPGALEVAENVNIDQENILSNRRGFKTFGSAFTLTGSQSINSLHAFKDRLLTHYATTLAYDSNGSGSWTSYSGSYAPPSGEQKIKSVGASGNFYFTTDAGIGKIDSLTGTPTSAGVPKALGGEPTINSSTGFFTHHNQLAYRVVWGYEDANGNLILGAPSERMVILNESGASKQVNVNFSIPSGITTSYFYQIYRTGLSGGNTIVPNDEMQLVAEKYPTSAQITAKTITHVDNTSDSLRGATLYTSPSQQGIGQANERPPMATDLTAYKGHIFYFNTTSKHRLIFTIIAVNNGNLGYYSGVTVSGVSGSVITVSSADNIAVGQLVTAASGLTIPANTTVTEISGTDITLSNAPTGSSGSVNFHDRVSIAGTNYYAYSSNDVANNYFFVPSTGTLSDDIEDAARNLIKVINESTSNTAVYGYYLSGVDDLPGKILIEERSIGGSVYNGTSSKGGSISPEWSETTNTPSTNERSKNRVYISKYQQPESVPTLNYIDLGSADKEILRGIALRDSCFVFKKDGIFRITGESVGSFQATLFDNTAVMKVKESAVELNNQIFCFSDQGIVSVSDSGVQVLSRPIEEDLKKLQSANYPDFGTASFGVGYESERKYIFYTVKNKTDEKATQAFVYNVFTDSWTTWLGERTCGIVNPVDDKLYLGSGDDDYKYVYQERKAFDIFDNAEEEFSVTISSFSGTSVVVASLTNLVVGQTLAQSSTKKGKISAIDTGTNTLTIDRVISWATGSATAYNPIATQVKYAPAHGGNPGMLKHFSEVVMFFREADFKTINLKVSSNFNLTEVSTALTPVGAGDWGAFAWGSQPWGDAPVDMQPIRTYIPLGSQRASWLSIKIQHQEALTKFALAGFSLSLNGMSTRFK